MPVQTATGTLYHSSPWVANPPRAALDRIPRRRRALHGDMGMWGQGDAEPGGRSCSVGSGQRCGAACWDPPHVLWAAPISPRQVLGHQHHLGGDRSTGTEDVCPSHSSICLLALAPMKSTFSCNSGLTAPCSGEWLMDILALVLQGWKPLAWPCPPTWHCFLHEAMIGRPKLSQP